MKPTVKCKQTGGKGRGELKFSGTYQLLVYGDSVNLLDESIYTVKQNRDRMHDKIETKKIRNKPFGWDEKFKCLGATLTIQNCIHEEIKSTGELGECLTPSSPESSVFQFAIQKYKEGNIQNRNFACYYIRVCDTWSLTSREEHRLRVFENRVLRKIFCPEREQVAEEWWRLHN